MLLIPQLVLPLMLLLVLPLVLLLQLLLVLQPTACTLISVTLPL
jgi:hypothetical protein